MPSKNDAAATEMQNGPERQGDENREADDHGVMVSKLDGVARNGNGVIGCHRFLRSWSTPGQAAEQS